MARKFDAAALARALLAAESEAEVQKIIENTAELNELANWLPLDGRETNYNVTTNQQASGPKAATELMTNMVDALLLKVCRLKGIDPRDSKRAPRTMHEAVATFFGYKGGKLLNAETEKVLSDFAAKNLMVGITGARTKADGYPCYTFADNGEGQDPDSFEETFLSLSQGNKKDIAFVQGKFNMGSSGVLSYCGRRWFKLIVSRRFDKKKPWGWTLMRRRPGPGMPVAEYFKLGGKKGAIPSFDDDMLFPFKTAAGDRYGGFSLDSGTVVKLYDFQIGAKFLSFRGAREALNENLVETILPFRILDFRQVPKTKKGRTAAKERGGDRALGIDARPFYGMEYLLLRAHSQETAAQAADVDSDDEDDDYHTPAAAGAKIHVDTIEDPELGQIEITAIPLKRKIPTWLKPSSTNNRIFHAVNGQVQFKQTRGFFTNCGFGALKDRAIIIVDASRLTYAAHNDVWKSDRESVRETQIGERYLQLVRIGIERSDALRELQEKVAKEELTLINDQQSNDLFEKLVKTDRSLANLLGGRNPAILLRGEPGGEGKEKKFESKYSPTFVRLEGKLRNNGMDLPINYSRPFSARTDAENGYLIRDDNRGRLFLSDETLREKFVIRQSLRDGRLTVYLQPVVDRVKPGDSFTFDVGLRDDAMPAPVIDTLTVRIGAQVTVQESTDPKPPRPVPPNPSKTGRQPDLGLPQYVLLTKDGRSIPGHPTESWPDDFSDHDGGLVKDLGNGRKVYKINYDNSYHLVYRQRQRGDAARDVISQKYIIGMRLLMLGLEHALNGALSNGAKGTPLEECEDQFRLLSAKGAATTVLAVADHLPKLMEPLGTLPEPE
jgi:hypothetical protein